MRFGIKSITMDDISRELGISKKTLYQYVANKSDLIEQLFRQQAEQEKEVMRRIHLQSANAIDELLKIARYVMEQLRQLSATTVYDLQKYYPESWKQLESLHQRHVYTIMKENLERGIREGVYRSNVNLDIVAKLCVGKSSLIADDGLFPSRDYNMSQLYREYINYHIHGIASPKGLQVLEKYLAAERQSAE